MDHLPKVDQAQKGYPAVPFLLCDAKYPEFSAGYETFRHFPHHCGYNLTFMEGRGVSHYRMKDIIPLLQSWLFFGLLTEIFAGTGIPFKQDDFIREEDGKLFVTTKKLTRYMWYWMAAHHNSSGDKKKSHGELVALCLQLSNKTLNAIVDFHITKSENSWDLNSPTIAVLESLFILGEALSQARRIVNPFGSFPSANKLRWSFSPLKKALIGGGWCIGEVANLFNECDSSTLLYLSTFDRYLLGKDHKSCDAKNFCQANRINYETYKTKHVIDCPIIGCENIGPHMKDVASILRDGHIPVIAVDSSVQPNMVEVLSYQESEFHNEFIAISHVWSDGLGNPHDNSLPRCQLVRIQKLVNNLYVQANLTIPFWIDTICVPLDPELKILAIERMAHTYSAADGVLVLDNSLQYTSSKSSPVELMMRVRYSLWTTRLWTFQEGRLSGDLWFQFQDEAVSMTYLQNQTIQDNLKIISDTLLQDNISVSTNQYFEALARALSLGPKPSVQKSLDQYAILPKQENPREEEARLSAIQILAEHSRKASISRTWKLMLAEVEPQAIPSPEDYDLRGRMETASFGTVRSHAFSSIWMVKGVFDASFVAKGNYRSDRRFVDVCRGFRGRSTSRMEDETICLSVLLGLDVRKVQEVSVIPWRIKEAFTEVGDFALYCHFITKRGFYARITADIEKLLVATHQARMKIVLSQIKIFPKPMIFWKTPRLRCQGWSWAPFSFLHKDLDTGFFLGGPTCQIVQDGLMVESQAVHLTVDYADRLSIANSIHKSGGGDVEVTLIIRITDSSEEYEPNKTLWLYFRLWTVDNWLKYMPQIQNNLRLSEYEPLAILLEKDNGILVWGYRDENSIIYARQLMLVDRVSRLPSEGGLYVSGKWLPKQKWCVG